MVLSIRREMDAILQKLEKAVQKESEKDVETKKTSEKTEEHKPTHNSLQHEPSVSVPLLSLLVEALKKDNKDDEKEGLETIAEEVSEDETTDEKKRAKKDAIVALADRIKSMYATEMMQEAYAKAMQSNYNPAHYQNNQTQTSPNMIKPAYEQDDYSTSQKNEELEKKRNESSTYSKLAGGDKLQAFIMTDPRGRLHSTWEIVRILNETSDGKIERNDGLHYQGLS